MSEWKEVKLQNVVSKLGDGLHGTPKYDDNGEYYFINGNNLDNGKITIKDSTKKTSIEEYKKYKKDLNNRTILVSINGTLGNIGLYNNEKCFLGKSACYFNVKENVEKLFIKYVVTNNHFQEHINVFANGTTIKNVSLKTMREYPFFLPPLHEQKVIAEVLSSLDDKIDLLHRQNKTLEQMAETLFRQWFVEEVQEDWKVIKIGDYLDVLLGGTPSTKNKDYWNGNIPWVNSGEINKFRILEPTKYITQLGLDNSSTKLLPKGTTVLAITGATLGQVSRLEIDACANQSVIGIIGSEEFTNEYIYLWIKHYIKDIISNQTGGAQQHINRNDVKNTTIIKPDEVTYEKFMNLIKPIFDKISKNSFQIRTLEQMRDTLLPKLMRGEIRVKYGKGEKIFAPTDKKEIL